MTAVLIATALGALGRLLTLRRGCIRHELGSLATVSRAPDGTYRLECVRCGLPQRVALSHEPTLALPRPEARAYVAEIARKGQVTDIRTRALARVERARAQR